MDFLPGGMSPEDQDKLLERVSSHMEVNGSPLVRVVAIGKQAEASGIRVELIALEIREAGAILHWNAFSASEQMIGSAVIDVSDEAGGAYDAFPSSSGGSGHQWKVETEIVPSPGPKAESMRVAVRRFDAFGLDFAQLVPDFEEHFGTPSAVEGPWVFEFAV